MKDNLTIWQQVSTVPDDYLTKISGGRLSGKSDINPTWRLMKLTEIFGMVGFGWRYDIKSIDYRQQGTEVACFVIIDLYVKLDGEWSEPISGQGGSMFVATERNGLYVSDECLKMAVTDAISVACKQLGIAADIYLGKSDSKYSKTTQEPTPTQSQTKQAPKSSPMPNKAEIQKQVKNPDEPATEKQMGLINRKIKEFTNAGVELDTLKELLDLTVNKSSIKNLTKKEASAYIDEMESIKDTLIESVKNR